MIDPKDCPHLNFKGVNKVMRHQASETDEKIVGFSVDITIECSDCKTKFEWIGVPGGQSYSHPTSSADFTELRAPIRPFTDSVNTVLSYEFERPKETQNKDLN